ncbi:hypothetical protein HHX47_DHR7000221 [Lentinula edodes]|nr:hypothetical protein HHX47_DHR7000221 [Lentinula edodes]
MIFHCTHPTCKRTFPTNGGRNKHWNSAHREVTQEPGDEDNENFTYFRHPYLTASPTDQFGITLPQHSPPPPPPPVPEAHTAESWFPFSDRVEFDFAHLHFVHLQSSAAEIKLALDMWAAQTLVVADSCENQRWMDANQLYRTIDDIDDINVPWETFKIEYQGPRPPTPPAWMMQKYTLLIRNIQTLFHHQMRMKDFDDTCFNKVPYRQFNKRGERIRSNIMSADWAWKQCDILAEDPMNHGAMFVPFVSGSDKTTVSVATGHQEYHPVYASPCNVTNVTRRSHPFALCPIAFLAIPKTIVGYVPPDMIKAMSSFLDFCYIARRNSLSSSNLSEMDNLLTRFHHHRTSFINSGVREAISLPHQHGLTHYVPETRLFGSPNGLCSSITESKHIKSVKEPWRRSSHSEALTQMVTSITQSDKLVAMKRRLEKQGMTVGTTFSYMSMIHAGQYPEAEERDEDRDEELHEHADLGPATGPATKSSVHPAVTPGAYSDD